jgi:hypothetical protein
MKEGEKEKKDIRGTHKDGLYSSLIHLRIKRIKRIKR